MRFEHQFTLAIIMVSFMIISINCVSSGHDGTISNSENHTGASQNNTVSPIAIATIEPDANASIEPTRINIIAEKNMILAGGESDWIIAQLYYKGEPLRKKDANITFVVDDNAVATIEWHNYNLTDNSGATQVLLISNTTPGRAKVTVFYNSTDGTISNSTYVNVTRWGGIGGIIFDKTGFGIPNANVSLHNCHYNDSGRKWEIDDILRIQENPQLSNDGRSAPSGQFAFYRVPTGTYAVMAEKNGHSNFSIVTLSPDDGILSSGTCFVYLNYEYAPGSSPIDLPQPTLNGGTIWGIVSDAYKVSVPHANVSLWHCEYNLSTKQWDKTTMIDLPNNPQWSNNGKTSPAGEYRFDNLSQGIYYVTANYEGHIGHAVVHLNSNLVAAYIVMPEYHILPIPLPPSPTPIPSNVSSTAKK